MLYLSVEFINSTLISRMRCLKSVTLHSLRIFFPAFTPMLANLHAALLNWIEIPLPHRIYSSEALYTECDDPSTSREKGGGVFIPCKGIWKILWLILRKVVRKVLGVFLHVYIKKLNMPILALEASRLLHGETSTTVIETPLRVIRRCSGPLSWCHLQYSDIPRK